MRLIARIVVLVCVVAALAASLAFRFGSEHMWWVEIARYLPYPAYLAPAIVAVGLSWWLGRAWRIAAVLALALVTTQVMGLSVGRADEGAERFSLMTYNVKTYLAKRHADGFARLAWEIAQHDPDVLVMQDAQEIALPHGLPEPMRVVLRGRQVFTDGQYVVASRFPLRDCAPGDMSYRGQEDSFVRCTLDVHGTQIDLFTAHFVSPREGLNATRREHWGGIDEWEQNFADRLTQAGALARAVERTARPVIVAGDLNAEEDSPVVRRLLAAGLRDAFGSAGFGYGYTHGHSLRLGISFLRIDHVLVSPTLGVRDCEVGGKEASEHRPVIAQLLASRR
jgi:endonuclease/exonuclease/phosphatase (EEP) superfamily protein YafD